MKRKAKIDTVPSYREKIQIDSRNMSLEYDDDRKYQLARGANAQCSDLLMEMFE